jgi:hypothetical protein
VPHLAKRFWGKLFGDRGYLSQLLLDQLWKHDLQLITKLKKNRKNKLLPLPDKLLLRQRALIETVNDQLKNICQLEHARHRSVTNFLVNLWAARIAYTYQEKKSALDLQATERARLPIGIFEEFLRRTHVNPNQISTNAPLYPLFAPFIRKNVPTGRSNVWRV